MGITDTYKTIVSKGEGLFKEKGSKFISVAMHVADEQDVKDQLVLIKKQYHDARHHCFAFRLGLEDGLFRSNDDGEPSGSAGRPILNQIYSYEMYHILVVVVRYFGGIKLGVSGLVNAYKTAAREALDNATMEIRVLSDLLRITCEYTTVDKVLRMIKEENLTIVKQKFEMNCVIDIEVNKSKTENLFNKIDVWHEIEVTKL